MGVSFSYHQELAQTMKMCFGFWFMACCLGTMNGQLLGTNPTGSVHNVCDMVESPTPSRMLEMPNLLSGWLSSTSSPSLMRIRFTGSELQPPKEGAPGKHFLRKWQEQDQECIEQILYSLEISDSRGISRWLASAHPPTLVTAGFMDPFTCILSHLSWMWISLCALRVKGAGHGAG